MNPVVIAGAGISGLALAYSLRARGVPVLVLEREPRPGGKIASEHRDGYLCEQGPASYLDRSSALTLMAGELGLSNRIVTATDAAQRRLVAAGDRLHDTPLDSKALLASRLLSLPAKLRMLVDFVLPRGPSGKGGEESVADFGRRRLGKEAGERLLQPLVSGLYAGNATQVSLPSAFPLVATMERVERSFLLAMRKELRPKAGAPRLSSFQNGMDEFTSALARSLGDDLRLGTRILRVEKCPTGFSLAIENRGTTHTLDATSLVMALPAHVGTTLLATLDGDLAQTLGSIPYVPVTLVHLGYPASAFKHPFTAYGFFVPPSEPLRILGGIFPSMFFPGRAPGGHHLFSVRTGGARHPEFAALPDDEVVAVADQELRRLVGLSTGPSFRHVVRHTQALPQYTLGHAVRIGQLMAAEQRHAGLYFHGNAYHNAGVPELVARSVKLAERIAGEIKR